MFTTVKRMPLVRGLTKYELLFSSTTSKWFQIFRNTSSGLKENDWEKRDIKEVPDNEMSFTGFLQHRRDQARRSIVLQIDNWKKWQILFAYCSSFGNVNKMYHYVANDANFVVVEMSSKEELDSIVNDAVGDQLVVNHFALFDSSSFRSENISPSDIAKVKINSQYKDNYEEVFRQTVNMNLNISDKIENLYKLLKLNDLGIRLRFLTCLQLECLMCGLMRQVTIYPFGSSISGFGLKGSDLDLVALEDNMMPSDEDKCPIYFPKKNSFIERRLMQSHLEVLSSVMDYFLVGCKNVFFIRNARVPIIKFKHYFSALECDLSLYITSGVSMTQILYNASCMDDRVRPLVFIIKLWAKRVGLTSRHPGPHITNFSLTLLVIFFLQQSITNKGSVLPPLNIFPYKERSLMLENEELSAMNNFKLLTKINEESLEELLILFFDFYSSFDFRNCGCCIKTGKVISNIENSPLYIKNPIEPTLNVSKNVTTTQIGKFRNYAMRAKEILQKSRNHLKCESRVLDELLHIKSYDNNKKINFTELLK